MNLKWFIGLVAILTLACAAEQSERVQVGEETYGETSGTFRGQWWNYFERGMSYTEAAIKADEEGDTAAKEKTLKLAESDLMAAIKRRDMDQRRARTYGMHLIDYFPHRELGVAYYYQGRFEEAIGELETSLSTVESAKAQFYLDKARKAMIERKGGDTTPPGVSLEQLPRLTKEAEIEIVGFASDDGFVAEIQVGDESLLTPVSQKKVEFRHKVTLNEGPNEIKVSARDLIGNIGAATVTVVSDTTGPSVTIEDVSKVSGKFKVKGWVDDASGVKRISVGDQEFTPHKDGSFETAAQAGADGTVSFQAEDQAGNITTGIANPAGKIGKTGGSHLFSVEAQEAAPLQLASWIWPPEFFGAEIRGPGIPAGTQDRGCGAYWKTDCIFRFVLC